MHLKVYLSGEIHTEWRSAITTRCSEKPITFLSPVTIHESSDDCGVNILGSESSKFWHDHKSAKVNAIRTRKGIEDADIVVVCFGEKYKQWNAAFDAGYAIGLSKSLVVLHNEDHQHALKEVNASASAVTKTVDEVVRILQYTATTKI